jgi:hypothetical protein
MTADQKDDQRVFQQKQRDLLMATKDLSKHSIHPDVADLEESLERGTYVLLDVLCGSQLLRNTCVGLFCSPHQTAVLRLIVSSSHLVHSFPIRCQETEDHS